MCVCTCPQLRERGEHDDAMDHTLGHVQYKRMYVAVAQGMGIVNRKSVQESCTYVCEWEGQYDHR